MPVDMRLEHVGTGEPLGKPEKITMHWSAGSYTQTFDHYHFNILGDGRVEQTLSIKVKGSHTWRRNSGNIGIGWCAMATKKHPVTAAQKEAAAVLIAELCGCFDIDPDADVKDHAYYAKQDGYFPDRWDVGDLMVPLLKRVKELRSELRTGKRKNTLTGVLR